MTYLSIDVDSDAVAYEYSYKLKTKSQALREFFAEFFGTFVMNVSHTRLPLIYPSILIKCLILTVDGDRCFRLLRP